MDTKTLQLQQKSGVLMSKDLQDHRAQASTGILGMGGDACPQPCLLALAQALDSGAADLRKRRRLLLRKLQGLFA